MYSLMRSASAKSLDMFFIDVEGGESTLIVTAARESLLIDAGYGGRGGRDPGGVGRDLADSLPATAVVAAPEIGALGYASNLHMLDTVGLVSPVALRYYPLRPDQLVTDNADTRSRLVRHAQGTISGAAQFAKPLL